MNTAALITDHRTLEVTDMDRPEPRPGEVAIDVAYCGLCGSDVHLLFDSPEPLASHTLGHEFSGTVSAVAADVTDRSVGDRVVVRPVVPCGECTICTTGDTDGVCVAGLISGPGLGTPGGLAGTVTVPASTVFEVPAGLGLRDAALAEPLAVAVRAVDRAQVSEGDTVVVMGAGPIGLLTVEALHARGLTDVLVIEPNASRREQARNFGVEVARPGEDVSTRLRGTPHAVIDCSGHPSVAESAIAMLSYGGRLVLVGIPSIPSQILLTDVVLKEIRIVGSISYSVRDFEESLLALTSGAINTNAVITSVVGLNEADAKIRELHQGSSTDIKVLIEHSRFELP